MNQLSKISVRRGAAARSGGRGLSLRQIHQDRGEAAIPHGEAAMPHEEAGVPSGIAARNLKLPPIPWGSPASLQGRRQVPGGRCASLFPSRH